jgi:phosphatidate cytidylyltransferase
MEMFKIKNELTNRIFTIIILLPILLYATIYSGIYLILLLIIFYFLSVYEIIINTKNILFILLSSILLIFSFFSFYFLRGETEYNLVILLWILTSTFLSDIGGYIFGRLLKGKKLTKISPNKTYSGAIGSIVLSCLSLPLINLLQIYFFNEKLVIFLQLKFLIFTFFISVVCQIGDLFVSFLKRKINIKNISNFLPGHGGVLDRIDGLIFVLIFCFNLRIFELI